jgi:3-oxoacyl-[acyl-carrier protein] reductase
MGNRIVITGASSKIGQAIFKQLVKKDDQVILQCFKNYNTCLQLKKTFKGICNIITSDFNDPESVDDFSGQLGDVDTLINTAASTITGLLPHLKDEDMNRMINVNNSALVKICRAVIPGMVARRKGCIVNISSVAAIRGNRGQAVYAGTKGFIEAFSRSLAAEYGAKGIRINCVAPGPIDAGSLKELLSYAPEEVKQSTASGRLGEPEDVAAVVAFLCSDGAKYINGRCIPVDGGFMRGI